MCFLLSRSHTNMNDDAAGLFVWFRRVSVAFVDCRSSPFAGPKETMLLLAKSPSSDATSAIGDEFWSREKTTPPA